MSASADYQVLNLNVVLTSSRLNTACACTARLVHGGESETKTGITLTNKDEDPRPRAKLSSRETHNRFVNTQGNNHACESSDRTRDDSAKSDTPIPTGGEPHDRQEIPTTLNVHRAPRADARQTSCHGALAAVGLASRFIISLS